MRENPDPTHGKLMQMTPLHMAASPSKVESATLISANVS